MKLPSIVDSHVHLWNPEELNYPWLTGMPSLNRTFLPADFSAATAHTNVEKMIFIEAGCDAAQGLEEVKWVSRMAETEPRLKGIVAHASLEKGEAVRPELAALASIPLVKGIRRLLQGERNVDFCLLPSFVTGVKLLAEFGFSFDVCIRHDQLPAVTELAHRLPQVVFILDHLGKPDVRNHHQEPWAANLKALAALPNVVCKISGLATEADHARWQPADLKFYLARAGSFFGPDRILFGSDWPVATLAADYERWIKTVADVFSPTGDSVLNRLFTTNAERIYHV